MGKPEFIDVFSLKIYKLQIRAIFAYFMILLPRVDIICNEKSVVTVGVRLKRGFSRGHGAIGNADRLPYVRISLLLIRGNVFLSCCDLRTLCTTGH